MRRRVNPPESPAPPSPHLLEVAGACVAAMVLTATERGFHLDSGDVIAVTDAVLDLLAKRQAAEPEFETWLKLNAKDPT